ncbi:NADPH:quinone oxidoreductase 2 [Bacteroides reticulotermitis JCM 10512]|uniref:NADPH:quinone oxidoreductase 2 n=1 Tax=Bacteroides reticulotermitis JCM 10512 TaxID=1445607 RepID=W4UVW5_9BACE|nr:NADPH:quinone oxidoreductase 2 [Bacteroides reticulotermitis JCM 10512]
MQEKGIEVRIGSFDDIPSLGKAVAGIDKVLLISGLDQNRLQQHKNVVDAAKVAGVKHIAYTGVALKDASESAIKSFIADQFSTEEYIRQNGLTYPFLRNTLYADTLPFFTGDKIFKSGIHLPASSGKAPFALRKELGEATANVLLQNGHENKTYHLTGSGLFSFGNIANILSKLSGKTIGYKDINTERFIDTLKQLGVPETGATVTAGFIANIKNRQYEIATNDLENLLGRKSTALRSVLKSIYKI